MSSNTGNPFSGTSETTGNIGTEHPATSTSAGGFGGNTMGTTTQAGDTSSTPSSMHGMKEKLAGTVEKGVGKMTGQTDRVVEGEARKEMGTIERDLAKQAK
ncbi:hypothetical protein SeMB42_g07419 [Synchytrium endobioticum]|uniref:CsbD-like domain-containing protein n=1 Tax=Synchytrium endobioticum TaxID=286115 RepID=A0A507C3Z6_9FUNG|nr:hypothetical protein SeLEV6574_g08457 [Synchytrium endobioticum]TPX33809.1 hypothetical protein SeMB42_g07419 [Synchytrium endobioticum]